MNRELFLREFDMLSNDGKEEALALLQILKGKMPDNHFAVLRLNRALSKAQMKGEQIPVGSMPDVAGAALKIIDGVANLDDRRILMSYYWHCEDVHGKKVPDVLKRNGFTPA